MDKEVGDAEYKESHQMNFGNTNYIEGCKTNQNNDMEILTFNPKEDLKFGYKVYVCRM